MTLPALAALSGLITEDVGLALYDHAARIAADQAIVEVGSYKGKSTCYLAAGAKHGNGAHVYAVDAWDTPGNPTGRFGYAEPSTRETFETQVRAMRLWGQVTPLQGFSTDVAKQWDGPPIGLLFIDADHAAHSVRDDYDAWAPHLAPDATVIFDDFDTPKNPGVRAAVTSIAPWSVEAGRLAVLQ